MAQSAYIFKRALFCLVMLLKYSLLQWYESIHTILGSTCALAYNIWIWKIIYITNTRWWHKKNNVFVLKVKIYSCCDHGVPSENQQILPLKILWEKQFCKMSFSWMYAASTRLYSAVPVNFLTNIRDRARNGVSFVDPASNWYSASVPLITYEMSYTTGQRYNGTRLFMIWA